MAMNWNDLRKAGLSMRDHLPEPTLNLTVLNPQCTARTDDRHQGVICLWELRRRCGDVCSPPSFHLNEVRVPMARAVAGTLLMAILHNRDCFTLKVSTNLPIHCSSNNFTFMRTKFRICESRRSRADLRRTRIVFIVHQRVT